MPKKPSTASKYEKNDPNFVSSSSQRNLPLSQIQTRSAISRIQMIDDDESNFLNQTHLFLPEDSNSSKMSITKEDVKNIVQEVLQAVINNQPKSNSPRPSPAVLTMKNYSFWWKSMKAAMRLQGLWLDPSRNVATLSEKEKVTNEMAAQYVLTYIDANNMSQITRDNENSFIAIWNLLKEFHEPRTASTLVDFYASLPSLHHRQGGCVRDHLLQLDRQFEKLLEANDQLPESHKVAIMLASVKGSPEFEQLFYTAKWVKQEDLTLQTVRESIIAAQDSRKTQDSSTIQEAHSSKSSKWGKSHTRRPRDKVNGWACTFCEMDNHKEADCYRKNNKNPRSVRTFKKQSHVATQETQDNSEASNIARAHFGSTSTSKRARSPTSASHAVDQPPHSISTSLKSRLGPQNHQRNSPVQFRSNSDDCLELHAEESYEESGNQSQNSNRNKSFHHRVFQSKQISQVRRQLDQRVKSEVIEKVKPEIHRRLKSEVNEQVKSEVHRKLKSDVHTRLKSDVHTRLKSDVHTRLKSDVHTRLKSDVHTTLKSDVHRKLKSKVDQRVKNETVQHPNPSNIFINCDKTEFCMQTSIFQTKSNKSMNSKIQTSWIIDSGASIHMCNNKEILSDFVEKTENYVTISDGSKIPIIGYGKLIFEIIGEDKRHYKFILEQVACVPKLHVNLISVKELTDLNILVQFTHQKCQIVHSRGKITIGTQKNNLYMMEIIHNIKIHDQSLSCIHDWHRKLGHRNIDHIKRVKDTLDLKIQKCTCQDQCVDCLKGKISAPPYPKQSQKPENPLALITSDLCGPFRTQTIGGARYFITFTDAATDYTEVVTLKHKSDSSEAIRDFMEKCKNQLGRYCHTYRADRGGEFLASDVQNFLREKGIKFEFTVPQSSPQNGISERKNRTLVEGIRTALVARKLPHYLWGEALYHINDTFNSIPKANKPNSPRDEFHNKKTHFEFIEFGTPVIFHTSDSNRSKLDQKGIPGIFVGHDQNSKGYRIFSDGKIQIKRIVKFLKQSKIENQKDISFFETEPPQEIPEESLIQPQETQVQTLRRSERIAQQNALSSQAPQSEPRTYKQALKCSDSKEWLLAMQKELDSIRQHETWTLVDLPKGRTAIGSKWVFKIKTDTEGKVLYKARLVAQGFTQERGEDYELVFAPVARPTSFRILLTLAGCLNMKVRQFDVKTAFLNGVLDEEIYMKPPQGFESTDKVLKLQKSLYGLKQAARVWNQAMDKCLTDLSFIQSKHDSCLYINKVYEKTCYLIVHVDDILMASEDEDIIDKLSSKISKVFELKNLGEAKQFIGINIERLKNGTFAINQSPYIQKIAETFQLQDTKGSLYPLDPGYFKLNDDELLESNNEYRKIIGMLLYVSTNTRPDVAAAVGILAQKVSKPRKLDLNECFRIIKYLMKTQNQSILLGKTQLSNPLMAYTDANWAEDRNTRKSTSGFICQVFDSTVSWSSKRQDVIATSTTESEFYALAEAVKELKWLKALLKDFDIHIKDPIPLHIDSQSCMKMIENEKFSNRTKHIDVRYHFAKDEILNGNVCLVYEPSESNIADMLTKPLAGTKIKFLREMANIKDIVRPKANLSFLYRTSEKTLDVTE
jgi:hypothetical protein